MSALPSLLSPNDAMNTEAQAPEEIMQVVTFTLGEEVYGLDIMLVREFRVWSDTKDLPNSPDFMMGVINLRGVIVPVFDLRKRFARGQTEPSKNHVVIVVVVDRRVVGLLVDAVSDIITFPKSEIRPIPNVAYKQESDFLTGLATVNDQMVTLFDPARLFSTGAVDAYAAAAKGSAEAA